MKGKSKTVKKILFIGDKKTVSSTVLNVLLSEGYNTVFAADGTIALKKAYASSYDIALLNTSLSDFDALELCKRIKDLSKTADIPVIFISSLKDLDNILQKSPATENIDYLRIPFSTAELLFKIRICLTRSIAGSKINQNQLLYKSIEDIKLYQESLKKSETKYRLMADYNYNWEFWLGPDGKYIYISPSCERLSGYIPQDFEDYSDLMIRLIHPEFKETCSMHFEKEHEDTGPEINLEFLIIDRYGNEKWISHNCNAVFDETGKFAGRRGNNSDITHKKVSEMELHKLSTAIEQSSSAVVITDIQGEIEYVNPYFEKLTGYKYKEVLGKKPSILKSNKTDPKIYEELWNSITSGNIWQGEFINKKKNNELYIENVIITPVKDKNSRIVNFIAIEQDVTKQKEIDRKIMQTIIATEEKERSRFAQDLHDDLGPLLSTAKLYIKSLETAKDKENKQIAISKSLEAIDESLLSIKEIANDLSPHILRNFGLVSGINSLVNKINETGTVLIEFESNLEERLDENIESSSFRIISELVNNTIKHAHADKVEISIKKDKQEILLAYSDDGVGFNLEAALEKQRSRGLSNIMNRVKSLGGDIVFFTGKGARVVISIPC